MNKKQKEQSEAVNTLKGWGVSSGTTVWAKVNKVSASGMSRRISLYLATDNKGDSNIIDISYMSGKAMGWNYKEGYNGGVQVRGCGMDMLFHTVDSLSYAMGYGAINQGEEGSKGLRYRQL